MSHIEWLWYKQYTVSNDAATVDVMLNILGVKNIYIGCDDMNTVGVMS